MTITAGSRLGPFEISARIGAGGMGEVWAATDTRLDRKVAIKVLPEEVADDPERLRRFEQEARAAGAISHPNLVTIFDIGSDEGTAYVVMELLEGETLREKIADGRGGSGIPVRKVVEYSTQIANGLSAAHDKGIVHRDLKPENVFVTEDGRVKILDFGLAKVTAEVDEAGADDRTMQRGTSPGTVLGTAGYMAPEQVRGRAVDARTDIFALGVVMYEMLAGQRAFRGDSAADLMSAILKEDPPSLEDLPTPVPQGIERVVRRCIEKAPAERFQSAHDIAFALDAVSGTSSQRALVEIPSEKRQARTIAIVAALLVASCAITGTIAWRVARRGIPATTTATAAKVSVASPRSFTQLTFGTAEELPSLSPDGKTFAFTGWVDERSDVYVQRADGRNAINLTKDASADSFQPAFSPDGNQIAFRSARDGGGIFVMGATGESVRRLSDVGFNPSWSPDGKEIAVGTEAIAHTPNARGGHSDLWILTVQTGAKRQLTKSADAASPGQDAVQPAWSPHGARIAYWGIAGSGGQRDLYTIDPQAPEPSKTIVRLTDDAALDWSPAWSPDGKWLLFSSDRNGTTNLWRLPMDEASGKATGPAEPMTLPARFAGQFTVARNTGDLAFTVVDQTETVSLLPFDPSAQRVMGEPTRIRSGTIIDFYTPSPSPDGEWWVFSNAGRQEDLYIMKRDGSGLRRFTDDPEKDRGPSFSDDGKLVYFYSQRGDRYEVWSIRPDGSDLRQVTTPTAPSLWYPQPVRGRNALIGYNETGTVIAPFDPDGTISTSEPLPPMSDPGAHLTAPRVSDDGTTIVGMVASPQSMSGTWTYSLATTRYERVSERAEFNTRWLPHSNHIIVQPSPNGLLITDITTKRSHEIRLPMPVTSFSFSPDGKTLLVNSDSDDTSIWLMKSGPR